jgi:hypothetical protein
VYPACRALPLEIYFYPAIPVSFGPTCFFKLSAAAVILLYGAKDERFNNAAALKEFIEKRIGL